MAAPALKLGSKGKLVLILQKSLNLKGKLPSPIPEDQIFGPETKEAVKFFQKKAGLKADGIVGSETAGALADKVGTKAKGLSKALGPPADGKDAKHADKKGADKKEAEKAGAGKTEEKTYNITYKGKIYALTKKEFDEVNKGVLAELKRTAVLAAQVRINSARIYWDTFRDLNKDQYVVSWFVSLAGPKLPDEGKIKAGEQAFQKIKSAVDSGDCRVVVQAFKGSAEPINSAYEAMMKYKEEVIGRSETWLKGLEFTRDTSFDIVSTIASAELGGGVGAGAIAGGGSELVKSAAGEFGKYLAGTSGGAGQAAKNIAIDALLGAGGGAAGNLLKGKKADEILKGVAKSGAKLIAGKWLGKLGTAKVEEFVSKKLEGAMKGGLEAAIKNAAKAIKGNTTPSQFFEEVAKGMGFGTLLKGLDDYIEGKKFAKTVYDKINSATRDKFFGKLKEKEAVDMLQDVIMDKGKEGVKSALEVAFDKVKGDEKGEDLGEAAAIEFSKMGMKALEAEFAKRTKTK